MGPGPMPSIFVSYRRRDAPDAAARIYERLAERFGEGNVFKDLDSMAPGEPFADRIERTIASCDAVLVVIGDDWTEEMRRRHREPDWVRWEIGTAFDHGVRVIPLYVEEGRPPSKRDLPDDIEELADRNGVELVANVWDLQVQQLGDSLASPPPPPRAPRVPGPVPVTRSRGWYARRGRAYWPRSSASPATSTWRRTLSRTRWYGRWNAGHATACRRIRVPGLSRSPRGG